jgi:hypothetical protein
VVLVVRWCMMRLCMVWCGGAVMHGGGALGRCLWCDDGEVCVWGGSGGGVVTTVFAPIPLASAPSAPWFRAGVCHNI